MGTMFAVSMRIGEETIGAAAKVLPSIWALSFMLVIIATLAGA